MRTATVRLAAVLLLGAAALSCAARPDYAARYAHLAQEPGEGELVRTTCVEAMHCWRRKVVVPTECAGVTATVRGLDAEQQARAAFTFYFIHDRTRRDIIATQSGKVAGVQEKSWSQAFTPDRDNYLDYEVTPGCTGSPYEHCDPRVEIVVRCDRSAQP